MSLFDEIREKRGDSYKDGEPLWKLRITDEEYYYLKQKLQENKDDLFRCRKESALCYAEWWRRDYRGGIPSKKLVAQGIGLPMGGKYYEDLYNAACQGLQLRNVEFITSLKGTEYFRTLLNQGGIPITYIKGENIGNLKRFLVGLIKELSSINYDWNSNEPIIDQLTCSNYLPKAFRNHCIYDVAMQIAHAIIMGDNDLLPYDVTDESFRELTEALKNARSEHSEQKRRSCPLLLYWKIHIDEGIGKLYVNMDLSGARNISSTFIKGLNVSSCYTFDIYVAGVFVGKYERKSINDAEDEQEQEAIYTRISVGKNKDILWRGEPVVEVKIICDNSDRNFLTVAGCYPPNFETPQVFQMLDDKIYLMGETANTENNIVIYSEEWKGRNPRTIRIENYSDDTKLLYEEFIDSLDIENLSGEKMHLTNNFTHYIAEFADIYLPWLEGSNYKLLNKTPHINVYDMNREKVTDHIKVTYKTKGDDEWRNFKTLSALPIGLVDIRVTFPDKRSTTETFYYIGNMDFEGQNEEEFSTEIHCSCSDDMKVYIEKQDGIEIENLNTNIWRIKRDKNPLKCPSVCHFRIYNKNQDKTLRLSVHIPFDIIALTDIEGNLVRERETISFYNLEHFIIVSNRCRKSITITYKLNDRNRQERVEPPHFRKDTTIGNVPLADYRDLIERMYNLYGEEKNGSVMLMIYGKVFYINKFVLKSRLDTNTNSLRVTEYKEESSTFTYQGDILTFPIGANKKRKDMDAIKLERVNEEENVFSFPKDFNYDEVIVFSGKDGVYKKIFPSYYSLGEKSKDTNHILQNYETNPENWHNVLMIGDIEKDWHWQALCKVFAIFANYNIPFTTHKGFKAIARDTGLLAKFIIAMSIYGKEVLFQEIDRFEQEWLIAIHWIPKNVWKDCIQDYIGNCITGLSGEAISIVSREISEKLKNFLQELFGSTLTPNVASEFINYIFDEELQIGNKLTHEEISRYKGQTVGNNHGNDDLPTIPRHQDYNLQGEYYIIDDNMRDEYKAVIESAMCAAENVGMVEKCTNLFSYDKHELARIANFYRKYFRAVYSDIFLRTIKIINKKRK